MDILNFSIALCSHVFFKSWWSYLKREIIEKLRPQHFYDKECINHKDFFFSKASNDFWDRSCTKVKQSVFDVHDLSNLIYFFHWKTQVIITYERNRSIFKTRVSIHYSKIWGRKTNCVLYKTSVTNTIQNVPCNFKSRPYSTTIEYNNEYIPLFVSCHLNHSSLCFYLKNKDSNKPEFEKRKWHGQITLSRHF